MMKVFLIIAAILTISNGFAQLNYPIVDTGQTTFYDNDSIIQKPDHNDTFYGQDANYEGLQPNYQNNSDGTITDLNTGLTWQKMMQEKMTYEEALQAAESLELGGYDDWRIPTIKELYSLIIFTGCLSP